MRFALTLGAAFAALTLAASAHTDHQRMFIRHGGGHGDLNIDADNDGWVTRAEAASAADRVFDRLDTNDDGRLDDADRAAFGGFNIRVDVPEIHVLEGGDDDADDDDDDSDRHVTIIRRGELDARVQQEVERAVAQAERAAEEAERVAEQAQRQAERAQADAERASEEAERRAEQAERQAERIAREAERQAERAEREAERRGERHVERNVIIVRGHGGAWTNTDGVIAPIPPVPPVPAVPGVPPVPMFMMLIANSDEADLNGDGALSREEFRAQHLRFFDASDANGDGRVRFDEPPVPPVPPTPAVPAAPPAPDAPPAPPAPPRHR